MSATVVGVGRADDLPSPEDQRECAVFVSEEGWRVVDLAVAELTPGSGLELSFRICSDTVGDVVKNVILPDGSHQHM